MTINREQVTDFEPIGSSLSKHLDPITRNYFSNIFQGKDFQPTHQQIDKIIEPYFSFETITLLTTEQETYLESDIRRLYQFVFSSSRGFTDLKGDIFLVYETSNFPTLYTGEAGREYMRQSGATPLSPSEKELLLTDPVFYTKARKYNKGLNINLKANGTRHLCDEQSVGYEIDNKMRYDTYGFTIADFTNMLRQVRVAQGKTQNDKLKGLDIGGSNGLGAHDAEQLDQNLDVTNITIDLEIGVWPLRGGHRFLLAERLPKDFSEQFDIIFSNLAFRYMRYRNIALENAIKSLKIGGILNIFFSSDYSLKQGETKRQKEEDIDTQFQRMEFLQEQGVIKYLPVQRGFRDAREDWYRRSDKGNVSGMVYLQKTGKIE
jgi:SAM-dependent methyltransferase